MIFKRTFLSRGEQPQDVAADLNRQIRDYLTETGLFQLVSAETGPADRPQYTLEYKDSGYQLILQSSILSHMTQTVIGVKRGTLDAVAKWSKIGYGKAAEATISIHLISSGNSFAFKVFNAENKVFFGGSCISYTAMNGEPAYLYNSDEEVSWLGYMGRFEFAPGKICLIPYQEYPHSYYKVIREQPIITLDEVAIGYANDLAVIHADSLSNNHAFSAYCFRDAEYHGGKIACRSYVASASAHTAAAFKKGED